MKHTLKEKAAKKLNDLKALKEQLNVQLHLSAKETKVEFEKQKKNLGEWLDNVSDKLNNVTELSEEKAQKLKASIQSLRVQAALGMAETDDAFKEQQHKINKGIQHLKINIEEAFKTSKEKINDFAEETDDTLTDFHTRFDLFRLQFHLGKEETKEAWEAKKKVIAADLHELEIKIDKGIAEASDKWESFSNEIVDSWKQLIKSFKN